eukprot:GDKJ01062487.1.p1 GENE.GDKJ01062487.1~~GDKJ01062487.1.p1  ORF type:complete len:227 (-),score=36.52 GDKJ01062487.1:47-727(-)
MADLYDDYNEGVDDEFVDFEFGSNEKVERWMRIWMNEKASPEILPFESSVVDDIVLRLRSQKLRLRTLGVIEKMVVSMEYERYSYMLRDYLKARLLKLHKIGDYVLAEEDDAMIPEQEKIVNRLSNAERSFIENRKALRDEHFDSQILTYLTKRMRGVDAKKSVTEPRYNNFVVAHVVEEIGAVQVESSTQQTEGSGIVNLTKGSCHILKYSLIRDFVLSGKMELI